MKLTDLCWPDVSGSAVAVLPAGATEQHGPHLPLSTDTDLVSAVANCAERRMQSEIVLCPAIPYGSSHHHLGFAGTLSLRPDLFTDLVIDLVESLLSSGFRRIVVLNGHGGNITPVRQALALLSHRHGGKANIALVNYWELGGTAFAGAAPMQSPALSHACEYETSMMLHIGPERVRLDRVERAARPTSNGYVPWEDDEPYRGVSMTRRTEFLSSNGSSGEPQNATAEKGQHLLNAAVDALVGFLTSFARWPLAEDLRNA